MIVELTEPPVVPEIPGIEVRNLASGEERAFHAVFERSFSGAWGHVERTFEDWWLRMNEVGSGDPAMLFVADRGGELVGEASCVPERFGGGWVGTLGVLPESRGQGIGKALLRRAFASFWERASAGSRSRLTPRTTPVQRGSTSRSGCGSPSGRSPTRSR
jgi:GNAT superfamily N-acetyltransferase